MSREHFDTGSSDGRSGGIEGGDNIVAPSAGPTPDVTRTNTNPNSVGNQLKKVTQITKGKLVGLHDSINATALIRNELHKMHRDVVSSTRTILPSGLKDAREHLELAEHYLHKARLQAGPATARAWESLHLASEATSTAHKNLLPHHPEAADLSINVPANGKIISITPSDLPGASTPPSPPRKKGKAPRRARVGNKVIDAEKIKSTLNIQAAKKKANIPGTYVPRPELEKQVRKQLEGTPIVPRPERTPETGTGIDPKAKRDPIEPLGGAAVDVGRTGDWSGAENTRAMPESVINKVDKEAKRKSK